MAFSFRGDSLGVNVGVTLGGGSTSSGIENEGEKVKGEEGVAGKIEAAMSRSMELELDSANKLDKGEAVVVVGAKDAKKLFACCAAAGVVVAGGGGGNGAEVVMITLFEVVAAVLMV